MCPYALLLFGGDLNVKVMKREINVGPSNFLTLKAGPRIGILVKRLRMALDELLDEKVSNPDLDICGRCVQRSHLEQRKEPDLCGVRSRRVPVGSWTPF